MTESVTLSESDLSLVNALQINPRAPWTQVGAAAGVSAETAARRWARLSGSGAAWITPHPGRVFGSEYCFALVGVQCEPGQKMAVARLLAEDPHAVSVEITAGTSDVFLTVATADLTSFTDYMLGRVDVLPGVTSTASLLVPRVYSEGSSWRLHTLDSDQQAKVSAPVSPQTSRSLSPLDRQLFLALCEDGRMSYEQLADRIGTSPATVRRHLPALLGGGVIALRCEVASSLTPWPVVATVRAQLPPDMLDSTGQALARLPQVRLCAAVTGTANLLITAWLHDVDSILHLESQLADRIPQLRVAERWVTLYTPKRMGRLLDDRGYSTGTVPMAVWTDPPRTPA